ncbi:TetR/AcrR family transcriptional regulator [Saccharopolyspora sp. NPDC050642]|uniref:TetR/AcrR family transcriptional regulator n=1 Tax=Saccharopolyspora sp. NPDC050642 TaxID=3157099 RepID=UPI0034051B9C
MEAAVALLDEEGADRLTMRRLAERLDTGSTTLYGHVATKDDVLDLALDAVYAEAPMPTGEDTDWKTAVSDLMTAWRAALLRHPWSAQLLGRPLLGPSMLARNECLHAVLARGGFNSPYLTDAAYALSNYVIGSTIMQLSWHTQGDAARDNAASHIIANRDTYPTLAAHLATANTDWDTSFSRGLNGLLDGLAHHATGAGASQGGE